MRSITRNHWIAPAVVVVATLAAYHNIFSGPFIFDDALSITHNPSIRSIWPLSSVFAPPSECTLAGRPFANLTFALNYAWGGTAVHGYHIVNLLFHIGTALLLFGIVRRTLELEPASRAVGKETPPHVVANAVPIALAAAVIWAVHPLLTASVTYISQRTELLLGTFYLGTLYAFIRGAQESSRVWYAVSVAACFLGAASKEGMVTAPVLVLLYDRSFVAFSFREALRKRKGYYISLIASWILIWLLMAGLKDRAVGFGLGVSMWSYALTECRAILLYLKLVLWPVPLIFDYGVSFLDHLSDAWGYIAGLVLLVAGTIVALIRAPRAGFLAAAFFLILAPTSSVVPIATQPIAENRAYLPAAAVIALLVLGLHRVKAERISAIFAFAAVALGCLTFQRNQVFLDPLTLWADTVAKRPNNPRAHAILGEMLHERRKLPEAKVQFEAALRLKPDYPEAYNNLGTTLYGMGDALGAKTNFEQALRFKPDYPSAHGNLGNLLLRVGDLEKAAHHCEEALRLYADPNRLKPDLAETHNTLGNVRLYLGNLSAARLHYQAAVDTKPNFWEARMNLGVVLRLLDQLEGAKAELERVVQARPDFPEAQFNLGVLFEQMGRNDDALRSFAVAVQLRPDFPDALTKLADLLRQKGDLSGAKKQLEAVVRLRPNDAAARASLDQVLARLASDEAAKSGPR